MEKKEITSNCKETDIMELKGIVNGDYSNRMKKRAKCILLHVGGMKNKKIAAEVDFTPNVVGNWVKRYREEGINGLFDKPKSGRKGGKAETDMATRIRDKMKTLPVDGADGWTVASLAEELDVSENSVRNVCRANGITLERTRFWSFQTFDGFSERTMEIVGLFSSPSEKAMVISVGAAPRNQELIGTFSTKNKDLATEIMKCADQNTLQKGVSLSQILHMAEEHTADDRRFGAQHLFTYLNNLADALPVYPGAIYSVIVYSDNHTDLSGIRHSRINYNYTNSPEEWLLRVDEYMDIHGQYSEDTRKIKESLHRYIQASNEKTEPFVWMKQPVINGGATVSNVNPAEDMEPHEAVNISENESATLQSTANVTENNTRKPKLEVSVSFTDEKGKVYRQEMTCETGLMMTSECKLDSKESVTAYVSNMMNHIQPLIDHAGQLLGNLSLKAVQDNSVLTVTKKVEIETHLGRCSCLLTGNAADTLRYGERLKTKEFTAIEAFAATKLPHRLANDMVNGLTRRTIGNNNLVNEFTQYDDVRRTGADIQRAYQEEVRNVLSENDIVVDKEGAVQDHSALDRITGRIQYSYLHYAPNLPLAETASAEQRDVYEYVDRYNGAQTNDQHKIQGEFTFEQGKKFVYVCADDVFVHKQMKKVVKKNGIECIKDIPKWVYHSVAYIGIPAEKAPVSCDCSDGADVIDSSPGGTTEADGDFAKMYILEAPTQEEVYTNVLAFLIKNNLTDRYLVLFTDGEETLKTIADRVFSGWPHRMYMDYYHVKERMTEFCSKAFKAGKIVDHTIEPKKFKNGKVIKSTIAYITRSKYYLREIMAMLWVGNVDGAISYMESLMGSDDIKGASGLDALKGMIGYLQRKKDRIPCFALRAHLKLRNTSNSVENANNVLVAKRQKNKGRAWLEDGSFAVSSATVLFENDEVESYFKDGVIPFKLRLQTADRGHRTGLEWIHDHEINMKVSEVLKEMDSAAA